jgi:hypothetical protein
MQGRDGYNDEAVKNATGVEVKRARRWHLMFERMGLLFRKNGETQLTDLGKLVANAKAENPKMALAKQALETLSRYQLKNPVDEKDDAYPDDCDVHPYWAVWKACDELDGTLHWDEFNREIMRVLKHEDLDDAIARIRAARLEPDYDPTKGGTSAEPLRDRCYDNDTPPKGKTGEEQVRDQITTPWFKRASLGEFLLSSPGLGGQGYWSIRPEFRQLIHDWVSKGAPSFRKYESKDEWNAFLAGECVCSYSGEPASNTIFFGPPGTGKSTRVKTRIAGSKHVLRTQFHPEFTHADFVGSYRPVVGSEKEPSDLIRGHHGGDAPRPVNYFAFVPGPLTLAIEQALSNSDHVFLVIEEINRGDCAAIFGDVFQLLDRDDEGRSEFGIVPKPEMTAYLKAKGIKHDISGDGMVYLPPNLSLIATMNTSDQSLQPMDSAFKRRWQWIACHVDFEELLDYTNRNRPFLQDEAGTRWDWIKFLERLNADIVSDRMEDKQVGPWFIKPSKSGEVSLDMFLNKCLFYLWHDVFKDEQLSSDFSPFRRGGPATFGQLQHEIRRQGLAAGIKDGLLCSLPETEREGESRADTEGAAGDGTAKQSDIKNEPSATT